jgi:trans-aconitate methyltransferase
VLLSEACFGDTDKAWHGYLPFYERHLVPAEIRTITEIGVWTGGSLRMWARWVPHAQVIGIDIEAANYIVPTENAPDNVTFVEGDVTTVTPWASDVVIDDGSHHGDDQTAAFDRFWPLLSSGGWYVIEDLETVYHDDFRRGDLMRSWLAHRLDAALRGHERGTDVAELHAYEQIVFVRKR